MLSTIQVVTGLLFLLLGLKTLLGTADPDAPPPAWTEHLTSISSGVAFALGLILALGLKVFMILLTGVTLILGA